MNAPTPKTTTAPDEALSSLMGAALNVPHSDAPVSPVSTVAQGNTAPLADVLEIARETGLRSFLHGVNAMEARTILQRFVDALPAAAPAAGNARDAALWRAYAAQFPGVSAAFLAVHGDVAAHADYPLPTIKGASIMGGYVIVTPAGWDSDKATKVRDAILRLFPVNPAHTPQPSAAQQAEQGAGR